VQFCNCVLIEFILYVRGSYFVPVCVRWYGRSVLQWRMWRGFSTHLEYSGSFIISQRDSLFDITCDLICAPVWEGSYYPCLQSSATKDGACCKTLKHLIRSLVRPFRTRSGFKRLVSWRVLTHTIPARTAVEFSRRSSVTKLSAYSFSR